MPITRGNEAVAAGRCAAATVLPQARARFGAALMFAAVCGSSVYTLWEQRGEPAVARQRAELRLDPNTASRSELMLLPGIGPSLSRQVVQQRQRCATQPAFRRPEDLDDVRGIGPAEVERLRQYLQFAPSALEGEQDP